MRSWFWIVRSVEPAWIRYITASPSSTAAVSASPATTVTRIRTVRSRAPRTSRDSQDRALPSPMPAVTVGSP